MLTHSDKSMRESVRNREVFVHGLEKSLVLGCRDNCSLTLSHSTFNDKEFCLCVSSQRRQDLLELFSLAFLQLAQFGKAFKLT